MEPCAFIAMEVLVRPDLVMSLSPSRWLLMISTTFHLHRTTSRMI